jgi:hypothetical protein
MSWTTFYEASWRPFQGSRQGGEKFRETAQSILEAVMLNSLIF